MKMIPSNKTIFTLEYRELLHLVTDDDIKNPEKFNEAFTKMKVKFNRIDEIMSTIKIGDKFVFEDIDGGWEVSWFDLEVTKIVDYELGIVMCIEPNTFNSKPKKHYISRILTVEEFKKLMDSKKK